MISSLYVVLTFKRQTITSLTSAFSSVIDTVSKANLNILLLPMKWAYFRINGRLFFVSSLNTVQVKAKSIYLER